jgi:hypothetical protein
MVRTKEEARRAVWSSALHLVRPWRTTLDVARASPTLKKRIAARVLADLVELVKERGGTAFEGFDRAAKLAALLMWASRQKLHSPRVQLLQTDLPGIALSAWRSIWDGERRDGAVFAFTGLPTECFDALLSAFERPSTKMGRPTIFTEADCLALALRFMVTAGPLRQLETDFGVAHTVLHRELSPALIRLHKVLLKMPAAYLRMPTLEEAREQETAARRSDGEPPEGCDYVRPAVLYIDGTVYVVEAVADKETQARYAYRNGLYVTNCIFMFDQYGCIVDCVLCGIGVSHDSDLAAPMFADLHDPAKNPHKIGAYVDNGFRRYTRAWEAEDRAAIFRPMTKGKVRESDYRLFLRWSDYCIRRRQANERAIGALKRSWPRVLVPMKLANMVALQLRLELSVLLQNFRTRTVGFNPLKTQYFRHVDDNFAKQLADARREGGAAGLSLYLQAFDGPDNVDRQERRRLLTPVSPV